MSHDKIIPHFMTDSPNVNAICLLNLGGLGFTVLLYSRTPGLRAKQCSTCKFCLNLHFRGTRADYLEDDVALQCEYLRREYQAAAQVNSLSSLLLCHQASCASLVALLVHDAL